MNTTRRFLLPLPLLTLALTGTTRAQLADLTVTEFTPSTTHVVAGAVITARVVVKNVGVAKARANRGDCFVGLPGGRHTLHGFTIPELGAGKQWSSTLRIQVPAKLNGAGSGTFVLRADVRDEVRELREGNNFIKLSATGSQRPDLTVSNLQSTTREWARGQTYTFAVRVNNAGGAPSRRCRIGAFLSSDPTIDRSDTRLTSRVQLQLQACGDADHVVSVRIPTTWPTGVCAIGFYVDTLDEVAEAFETNNAIGLNGTVVVNGGFRSIGAGCRGSFGVPVQIGTGAPRAGATVTFQVNNAMPRGTVMTILGLSNRTWGNVPLPLDLAPLGARGCSLLVSFDVLMLGSASPTGIGTRQLQLPASAAGVRFYTQFAVASRANRLGLAVSNALETTVGTR